MPIGIIIAKMLNKKKTDAIYAKYASMFPTIDNCVDMQKQIDAAQAELNIVGQRYYDVKGIQIAKKAAAKRERDTLNTLVIDMKDYLKDLQCGIANPANSVPSPQQMTEPVTNLEPVANPLQSSPVQNQTQPGESPTSPAPAAASNKKLWLYAGIGGVVLVGIIIYAVKRN